MAIKNKGPIVTMYQKLDKQAEYIIKRLKEYGIVIQRYDSFTSNSIYLKLDYGVINSIRISDHPGKKHLAYRYNLIHGVPSMYSNQTSKGLPRHYFPYDRSKELVEKILTDRENKLDEYGEGIYVHYMKTNKENNQDAKGFWKQAKLV